MRYRPISFAEVSKTFRLSDSNVLERYRSSWKTVVSHTNKSGYQMVRWNNSFYPKSRIVYVLYNKMDLNGCGQIDHINGVRDDNTPSNLRLVSHRVNHQNKKVHRNGRHLPTGVYMCGNKFQASIRINYKHYHLGTFSDSLEAGIVYLHAMTVTAELETLFGGRVCQ